MPSLPSPKRRASRLGMLDALRFVAALSVVAFHFTGINPAWDGPAPHTLDSISGWASYGAMGVPLFFVISGFVVLMTAWGRDVPHFVASRVGRLFPAYWAAVVFSVVIAFFVWPEGSAADGNPPTPMGAVLNLTMLQGAFGVRDLDGAYWTLWYEARFYALIAVFILVGITRRRVLAFATLWPIIGALAQASFGTIAQDPEQGILVTILMPDYAPYFAGGMLLYVLYRDGHDLGTWLLLGLQSVLAVGFATSYYTVALTRATSWPASTAVVALLSMACFGLVALVTLTSLKHRSAGWMTFLGALTYPLYLIHEKLGLYVIHVLNGRTGPWIAVGTAVVLALVAATLLYLVVERPWGGRLRAAMLHTLQRGTPGEQPAVPQQPDRSTLVRAHRPALIGHAPAARTETRLPVPAGPHD